MKLLKNNKIQFKVSVLSAALIIFIFLVLGYIIFLIQKEALDTKIDNYVDKQFNAILSEIKNEEAKSRNQLERSLLLSSYYLKEVNSIKVAPTTFDVTVLNIITRGQKRVTLHEWLFEGSRLHLNSSAIDDIKSYTGTSVAILQKDKDDGFVFINTNIILPTNEKLINYYLPPKYNISRTINRGEIFSGKIKILDEEYMVRVEPYYIKGKISGGILVALPYYNKANILNLIKNISIIPNSTLYIGDYKGNLVFSSNDLKMELPAEVPLMQIYDDVYKQKGVIDNFETNILYVKKILDSKYYIYIEIPVDSAYKDLYTFRKSIFISTLISVILLFMGLFYIFNPFILDISNIFKVLDRFAEGNFKFERPKTSSLEAINIFKRLEQIIKGTNDKIAFLDELIKENYEFEYTPLSSQDKLGFSLLELRFKLKKSKELLEENLKKESLNKWIAEGNAMFSEILRQYSSDITVLTDELIKSLVKYLKIPQGGIFITEENNDNSKYLKLYASYAYNRKKYIVKKIAWGDGLIGACAQEQYTMHVKEIPQDYLMIESGFGGKNPNNLLLSPIISEEKTLGIIELASFHEFSKVQIEFIEALTTVIGSSITISKLNTKTNNLLEESKERLNILLEEKTKLQKELGELSEKYVKLKKQFADNEFEYKTQIVKKQMIIDELNKRIENFE